MSNQTVSIPVDQLKALMAVYKAAEEFVNVRFNPATNLLYSDDKAVLLSYRVRDCKDTIVKTS